MSRTRLTLPGGQWIDVKDKLKVRDTRQIHSHSVDGMSADGQTYRFNVAKHAIATAATRITNWGGFVGDDGKPLPYAPGKPFDERVDVIESLDDDVFQEISKTLNGHFAAKATENDDNSEDAVPEKNDPAGGEPN
jgi:hypothetical protein